MKYYKDLLKFIGSKEDIIKSRKGLCIGLISLITFVIIMLIPYIVGGITFGFDMWVPGIWMLGIMELVILGIIGVICWFIGDVLYDKIFG